MRSTVIDASAKQLTGNGASVIETASWPVAGVVALPPLPPQPAARSEASAMPHTKLVECRMTLPPFVRLRMNRARERRKLDAPGGPDLAGGAGIRADRRAAGDRRAPRAVAGRS